MLDEIVDEGLARRTNGSGDEEQRLLHEASSRFIGSIAGGDPHRAEKARERMREKLRRGRADA